MQGSVELLEAHLLGTDDSENLEGNGRFDLRVPRTVSDSLEVLILGQDTPLAPSEPGSPGPSSIVAPDVSPGQDNQLAILALSGALIAAIAGFSWMAVKQRREGLMKALRDAMEFGLYDIVLAKAPRLVKGQYASEASLMTFVAGMHEEGTQATRTKLATSSALTKALDPAAKEFLHACIDAHEGNDVDAQSHLEACIELDASFQDEANNNPFLADVLQRILSKQRPADGYEFS